MNINSLGSLFSPTYSAYGSDGRTHSLEGEALWEEKIEEMRLSIPTPPRVEQSVENSKSGGIDIFA